MGGETKRVLRRTPSEVTKVKGQVKFQIVLIVPKLGESNAIPRVSKNMVSRKTSSEVN